MSFLVYLMKSKIFIKLSNVFAIIFYYCFFLLLLLLLLRHVISLEKLDAESVFYWSWVCNKCKSLTANQQQLANDQNNTQIAEAEEILDRLLPSLTEFCDYLQQ